MDLLKKDIEQINKKCENKNNRYMKQVEIIKNYKLQLETKIEVRDGYEKVLTRNKSNYSNSIKNKNENHEKLNNFNIGININVNNNQDDKEIKQPENLKQKNNNINIINNNNNIYVNNINIINPANFDYQINSINREEKQEKNYKNIIPKNVSSDNNNANKRKSFSFKKIGKFKIFGKKTNELEKIQIKINTLNKEIDDINNALIKHYKILDKEKESLERNSYKKENLTKKLEEMISVSEIYQNKLIKNLSEKLKLSEKFVNTNKY